MTLKVASGTFQVICIKWNSFDRNHSSEMNHIVLTSIIQAGVVGKEMLWQRCNTWSDRVYWELIPGKNWRWPGSFRSLSA